MAGLKPTMNTDWISAWISLTRNWFRRRLLNRRVYNGRMYRHKGIINVCTLVGDLSIIFMIGVLTLALELSSMGGWANAQLGRLLRWTIKIMSKWVTPY